MSDKPSICEICSGTRDLFHATTWGVSGRLLGCNTYYVCSTCAAHWKNNGGKSTLSPCNEKHVKTPVVSG